MGQFPLIKEWFILFLTICLLSGNENIISPLHSKLLQIQNIDSFLSQAPYPVKNKLNIPGIPLKTVPLSLNTDYPPQLRSGLPSLSKREVDFDKSAATHLLRRTVFGPKIEEITNSLDIGLEYSVEQLIRSNPLPDPPNTWINEPFPQNFESFSADQIDSLVTLYYVRIYEMRNWWLDLMLTDESSVREMMVLFWHDHFATSTDKVIFPPAMYHQNDLLREHALGNFKTLVREISYDPAMLIWLDNNQNKVDAINENFTRELLELFTIGIGNYSQEDIIEAARAFTGWATNGLGTYFFPSDHDYGEKTFMGQTGYWFGDDIIDIIFEQEETARFICRKLYQWFVYYNPDEAVVEELANILRENNYEIKPVLEALFLSEYFYDDNFRGAKYKGPIYFTVGNLRQFYIDDEPLEPGQPEHILILYFQELFGQVPLNPPDVSGWAGYRSWINTYSLPYRKLLSNGFIDGYIYNVILGFQADVLSLAEQMSSPSDPEILIEDLCGYLYSLQPSQAVKDQLVLELLDGSEPYDWSLYLPESENRLQTVIKHMLRLGEYQLR